VGNAVRTHAGSSIGFALALAVEYNLSSSVGLIAGVEFSVAEGISASLATPIPGEKHGDDRSRAASRVFGST
jgi:hypothetical protein